MLLAGVNKDKDVLLLLLFVVRDRVKGRGRGLEGAARIDIVLCAHVLITLLFQSTGM